MSAFPNLEGKVAVVTGAASGIGLGIARQLRASGMEVVIADIQPRELERAAAELGATGVVTDVSDAESVRNLASATIERHGAVHVVVNNAGVGPAAPISALRLSDWQWMLGVNLWGVIHGVDAFLPLLKQNPEGGHIVNTSSVGGLMAGPGMAAYSVTKFGITALTESLVQELAAEDSKVGASLLVPGTVTSNIKESLRHRPAGLEDGGLVDVDLASGPDLGMRWMEPDEVGVLVVEAIKAGDLYIVTHPEAWPMVSARHDAIAAAFRSAEETRPR